LKALDRFDDSVARAALAVRLWLVWPFVYAMALGGGLWALRHEASLPTLANNRLPWPARTESATWMGAALAAIFTLYLVAAVVRRFLDGHWSATETFGKLNRWLAFTIALPFVAALRIKGVERSDPIWTAVVCAIAAAAVAVTIYHHPAPSDPKAERLREAHGRRLELAARLLAPAAAIAIGIAYGAFFSDLSVTNHHAMNTRTTDLGYYDNIFYQSIHGRPLGCTFIKGGTHISGHFDPLLVLLSPIYLIHQSAETILVLQSVWLASGVVPLFLMASTVLRSRGGAVVLCLVYALYPAMHGANMYEFHSLTLITPLVLWLFYFFEIRARKRYALVVALLLLCREDIPLLVTFFGFYALLRRRPGDTRTGWMTIVACVAYFVTVKRFIMYSPDVLNAGDESYGYAYYFADLIPAGKGALELVLSILTNPWYAFKHAFANEKKVLFLLQLFVPLALLPFYARAARVALGYGLFLCLAASREPVFTVHFQYSCLIFPAAFAMTPLALNRLRDEAAHRFDLNGNRVVRAALGFMLTATLLFSWKFGAIVENDAFRGGFSPIARKLDDRTGPRWAFIAEMKKRVEPGASVTVTNATGPHMSNRAEVYFYSQKEQTHYVFIYERELKKWVKTWHDARLKSGGLVELGSHDGLKLYRRVPEKDVTADDAIRQWRKSERPAPQQPRRPAKPEPANDDRPDDPDDPGPASE
jgi:uncharacterized membrane protein